jgi:hypothetical protein
MKLVSPTTQVGQMIRAVRHANAWRDSQNPLRSLTMPVAVRWLDDARRGIFADLQWAYESGIEPANPDIVCIRERDEAALRDCEWTIKTIDEDTHSFDATLADEQAAFLRELYENIANLDEAIVHCGSYRFRGFAHVNPWSRQDDPAYIEKLHPIDQWNVTRDGYAGPWKWNPEARQVSFASLPAANLLDPAEYILLETRRPVNRIALITHVRATTAEKDWDAYVEIYGIPGVFVIMPEGTPEDKVGEYLELAAAAAEQASGALPGGSQVVTTQEARSTQPFQPRLEWLQKQVVLAGTGGLLTVLAESGSGTLAGSVHEGAFRQIARGVSRKIATAFRAGIDRPRLALKFPDRPVQAYFDLQAPEYRDVDKAVTNIGALAANGYRMPAAAVTELTGYEVEDFGPPQSAPGQPASLQARASGRAGADLADAADEVPALARVRHILAGLADLAADPTATDERIKAAVEAAVAEFPELLPEIASAVAEGMAYEMARSAVAGAAEEADPALAAGTRPKPPNAVNAPGRAGGYKDRSPGGQSPIQKGSAPIQKVLEQVATLEKPVLAGKRPASRKKTWRKLA